MDASEYYELRLKHTIEHLNQATRLIYFVSGAVVAMLYFVLDKIKDEPARRSLSLGLIVLIGVLFAMHGRFIMQQDRHYKDFDELLAKSVDKEPKPRRFFIGTGLLYAGVHWVVAAFAFLAVLYLSSSGQRL